MRQVSMPDLNELADLWDEFSPEDILDLENPPKDQCLQLPSQPSLGLRQYSIARYVQLECMKFGIA